MRQDVERVGRGQGLECERGEFREIAKGEAMERGRSKWKRSHPFCMDVGGRLLATKDKVRFQPIPTIIPPSFRHKCPKITVATSHSFVRLVYKPSKQV